MISSGITFIADYEEMKSVIDKLTNSGIYIISAFDNEGAVSFPAAFDSVIGVGIVQDIDEKPQVRVDSPVNITMPNHFYRLKWISPPQIIISGSSFAAAHIASLWAKFLLQYNEKGILVNKAFLYSRIASELNLEFIEQNSTLQTSWNKGTEFSKEIKKAIVFPWNKEIHSLARFQELLLI